VIGLCGEERDGWWRPLEAPTVAGEIQGPWVAPRDGQTDRPPGNPGTGLFRHPVWFALVSVAGADNRVRNPGHREAGPGDTECRQNQQERRQKPPCGLRAHLGNSMAHNALGAVRFDAFAKDPSLTGVPLWGRAPIRAASVRRREKKRPQAGQAGKTARVRIVSRPLSERFRGLALKTRGHGTGTGESAFPTDYPPSGLLKLKASKPCGSLGVSNRNPYRPNSPLRSSVPAEFIGRYSVSRYFS